MFKRTITISSFTSLVLLLICIFAVSSVYAAEELRLNVDNDMDEKDVPMAHVYVDGSGNEEIDSVSTSEEGIVYVKLVDSSGFDLVPIDKGEVIITVNGTNGSVAELPVYVGENGLYIAFGDRTDMSDMFCGYLQVPVDTMHGAVTTSKIRKHTELENVIALGRTLKVTVLNVHKGDIIKVKYAGKTYTKKINKNYKRKTVKIKTKAKKIKRNAKLKVMIQNKHKATLLRYKVKLKKGVTDLYQY